MNRNFAGKTVIITGASAGVGAACARAFAALNSKLVLVARGRAGLNKIAKELRGQGCDVLTVAMDVADTNDCIKLLKKAETKFGQVDVVINNAGMHARGDLETVAPEAVAAMVDINLRAPMVLSCAAIPFLRRSGSGAIAKRRQYSCGCGVSRSSGHWLYYGRDRSGGRYCILSAYEFSRAGG